MLAFLCFTLFCTWATDIGVHKGILPFNLSVYTLLNTYVVAYPILLINSPEADGIYCVGLFFLIAQESASFQSGHGTA